MEQKEEEYELWRQDDNGHKFVMAVFKSLEEAEAVRKEYERRGHKQTYWVAIKDKHE